MFNKSCRLGVLLLSCLLSATAATTTHAQKAFARDLEPASSSSSSSTYSPTVSFGYLPALQVSTPQPGSQYVANDFNGDGTSDLLWFNPSLSQFGYWTMTATTVGVSFSGGGVTRTGSRTINVTPGYFIGASGDFNHDGYADLIFTSAKRDLWMWSNNHSGTFTATEIGSYPSEWQLVGAGDINGDGYDDLLWVNPSGCEFAYWLMQGGTRISSKVFNIACGYYPMGIGYYSTSNRLSILWTSASHDLYVWDSTGSAFKAYNLSSYVNTPYNSFEHTWAIGGGFMGNGMGIEVYETSSDGTYDIAAGGLYSRTFDARGNQTGFSGGMGWDGGSSGTLGSAGYLIQANGVNATGLYMIDQAHSTISTGGLPGSDLNFSGNAPIPTGYDQWTFPVGWYVVGAPANGTAPLPWH